MKKRTLVSIGVCALVLVLIGFYYPQMMAAAMIATGRNPNCPWRVALSSVSTSTRQSNETEYIESHSKLIEKDQTGTELWETPLGRYWVPAGNMGAVSYDLAEQSRDIYGYDGRGVRAGEIVLDCGANVGVYTRHALNVGAKKVVAIEPAPENIRCLRKTFAKEIAEGRVVVYEKGVWDKDDILPMNIDPTNSAQDTFVGDHKSKNLVVNLPLTTIDKLVDELKLDRVDYIKFDIEGAERRAIAGATQTIAKYRPRMAICVYHLHDDPQVIPAAIAKTGQGYQKDCGACLVGEAAIQAQVFFFH